MCEHHLAGDPTALACERTTEHTPGAGCVYRTETGSDVNDKHTDGGHG